MNTTKPMTIGFETKSGTIEVRSLTKLITKTVRILSEIDRSTSSGEQFVQRWSILSMRMESPGTLVAAGELDEKNLLTDYDPTDVFIDGVRILEEGKSRPDYFSDESLEAAKELVGLLSRDVTRLTFSNKTGNVSPTQRLAASVDALVLPTDYEDWGTLEGELLDVALHGRPAFRMYDSLTGRGIACQFENHQLDKVKDALPHAVAVYGKVRYNRLGEPVTIDVESFEKITEPSTTAVIPVNITNGMDAAEYVRRFRNDD